MPLKNYKLVIGKPIAWVLDDDSSPHIEVLLDVGGEKFRASINVRSRVAPHTLVYRRIQPLSDLITTDLDTLDVGVYDLEDEKNNLALDYVRDGMVRRDGMEELPYSIDGPDNDLKDKLIPIVENAIASSDCIFYLFGETWEIEHNQPDKYFCFTPGRGIHDIHMNQGSQGDFAGSNGTNQDGALLVKQDGIWTGIFLAFGTQCWTTDDRGNCIAVSPDSSDSSTKNMVNSIQSDRSIISFKRSL